LVAASGIVNWIAPVAVVVAAVEVDAAVAEQAVVIVVVQGLDPYCPAEAVDGGLRLDALVAVFGSQAVLRSQYQQADHLGAASGLAVACKAKSYRDGPLVGDHLDRDLDLDSLAAVAVRMAHDQGRSCYNSSGKEDGSVEAACYSGLGHILQRSKDANSG
jgi:hypothetical protein